MTVLADTRVRSGSPGDAGPPVPHDVTGLPQRPEGPRAPGARRRVVLAQPRRSPAVRRVPSGAVAVSTGVPCGRARDADERWWLLGAAALTFFVVVLVGLVGAGIGGGAVPVPEQTSVVRVQAGETLWSIAVRVAPGSDPREVVKRIVELNDLGSESARTGQPLLVPLGLS